MKVIAFALLICFTVVTLLNSSQAALRRIKRSPPPRANATKLAEDFVELRTSEKGNEASLKGQPQANAAGAAAMDFKESKNVHLDNKQSSNENFNNNGEQQQQQLTNNNKIPKPEQRSLHVANSALAYLLQKKANHKLNGMTGHFTIENDAIDGSGKTAELVLIGGAKERIPYRDMRGSIACNAKNIADLSSFNNNGARNVNSISNGIGNGNDYINNNGNGNGNNNKYGANFNDNNNNNNNNNFDVSNNNANNDNNNMKISDFANSNYNKNNYDAEAKSPTDADQQQIENPMHQPETATCAAPVQQQQKPSPGQGTVVLSITHTDTGKPVPKVINGQNSLNRYEPMENVLKLANILLYKLDNLPPFRTGGAQVFVGPNGNSLPITIPENEDFDSIDYLYNNPMNPMDNSGNNQHPPISTVTTSPAVPMSLPLLPPLLFQSQFGLREPSAQPINLIESALDKLLVNGIESEDGDGDELELRCPIHHQTIKRNGTKGNVKDDIIQVCSCRVFKKKKNT